MTGPSARFVAGRIAACIAVWRAGGAPVPLAPDRGSPDEDLEGLVVTGGSDINPELFNSSERPWSPPDVIRDEYELAALTFAGRLSLPVLGICRGAQLMNVHAGGSLHTDIAHLRQVTSNRSSVLPRKWADFVAGSRLADIVGAEPLKINTLHHQAVKTLGAGLVEAAHDRDGIIQAIEGMAGRWYVGVQWHPEYIPWSGRHMQVFRALVAAASKQ